MKVTMSILETSEQKPVEGTIDVSRLPVLGEYIQRGNEWFQVKRVVHAADDHAPVAGRVFVTPIVDPLRDPFTMSEWLEMAPQG
ncbi:hypothetical protein Mal4_19130 [Maioricimonas rarisocia]|uniref:Uncharacterized protein n=1 Tax=Maioricimonas rarisocia TaxID=2528026 RepID=A0A517Z537_9PLAN|nr:hypothetical protein [Maioricimonas rarisocia]QDU37598.1 hypothetical protein Mal4_19130 [Maioricimonas rarisocia]